MKIKPQLIFIIITTLSGLSLFFLISMKSISPHLVVDALLDIDSLNNVPNQDLGKMASIIEKGSSVKNIHITLALLTLILGAYGTWTTSRNHLPKQ
ncbi:MAG: hypothetical protein ACSHX6_07650 [Akkermansiaceae bacterium]